MAETGNSVFQPTPVFRARRRRTLVKVQLFNSRDELQDVMVQDVSSSGMRATARIVTPALNEVVTVILPDGTKLWGIVRWIEGSQFGVEFDVTSSQIDLTGATSADSNTAQIDYKG